MKEFILTLFLLFNFAVVCHAQTDDSAATLSPKELKQFTKKANKGDVESMVKLWQYYANEEHKDTLLLVKYLELAADAGDAEAQTSMGTSIIQGSYGLPIDADKALYYTRKAANQGYEGAIYNLGHFYLGGVGVERDTDKACSYFEQAAMKGFAAAQFYYGACLSTDSITTDQAYFWIQKAADQGYIPAFAVVAEHAFQQGDYAKALKYAQQAAAEGDVRSMGLLGRMYYLGTGVDKDLDQARYWAQQAADRESDVGYTLLGQLYYDEGSYIFAKTYLDKGAKLGNNIARLVLADMYHEGKGVEKDAEKARALLQDAIADGSDDAKRMLSLYNFADNENDLDAVSHDEQSADGNDPASLFILSARYEDGKGVEKDLNKSFSLCKRAADMGYAPAQYAVAVYYERGQGTAKDDKEAFNYLLKSAKQDFDMAYGALANCYYGGRGTAVNYPEARYWGEKGVEKDDSTACYVMGLYYYQGKATSTDYVKALSYFQKSAELGSPDGLYGCFLCHKFGSSSIRDYSLAFKELRQTVDLYKETGIDNLNMPLAQYNLGICYQNGEGTAKDYKKAFYWFSQAVKNQNNNEPEARMAICFAQYNLGICYQNGVGTAKDYKKAFYWFSQAAKNQNNDDPKAREAIGLAQYNVAYYYYQGMGTTVNVTKAKYWLRKSAASGCQEAKDALRKMK